MHDCPHHNLPDWLLLNHFYGGLNHSSKGKLDMMSDGAFLGKPLEEAWQLLRNIHDNFHQWQCEIVHEEKPLPTDLENLVNEFLENRRGEIPYDDTLVRNVLSKAMPFIADHFNHIRTAATNDGEQPSNVTPISSTCCIIEAGKKGKPRKPKIKKNENKKPRVEIPTSRLTHFVDETIRFYEECQRNGRRLKKKEEKEINEWNKLKEGCVALKPYPPTIPDPYYSSDSSDDEDLHYSRIPNNCPEEVFDDSSSVCLNTLFGEINYDEPNMEPCVPPISVCYAFCFTDRKSVV